MTPSSFSALNKRALSISEAAEFLCVSRSSVRNLLSSGILPFEELPGRGNGSKRFILIRTEDLIHFTEKHYKQIQRSLPQQSNDVETELFLSPRKNNDKEI